MAKKMVISLVDVLKNPKEKRARRAMVKIRTRIAKDAHVDPDSIVISRRINETVFERGFKKIPRKISVMIQQDDAVFKAFLAGEAIPVKKAEKKKAEKKEEKKTESKDSTDETATIEKKKKDKHAKEMAAEKSAMKLKSKG